MNTRRRDAFVPTVAAAVLIAALPALAERPTFEPNWDSLNARQSPE